LGGNRNKRFDEAQIANIILNQQHETKIYIICLDSDERTHFLRCGQPASTATSRRKSKSLFPVGLFWNVYLNGSGSRVWMIQLALLRKQVHAFHTRFEICPERQMAKHSESVPDIA
jgi:hypothetical protein